MLDLLLRTARSLRAHATRFTLTSMGIVWGTAMLTVLTAYNDGYERHFKAQIDKVGPRVVWMFPGIVVKDRVGERNARRVELENEDPAHVAALLRVEHAAPQLMVGARIHRSGRTTKLLWTYGMSPESASIRSLEVAQGRFLSQADVESSARVVYLGAVAAERMFGEREAVGRRVHIEGVPFRVVGVGREKGDQIVNLGPRDDELSLIPITTAQRRFTHDDSIGAMVFAPTTREGTFAAQDDVRELLGLRHGFVPEDDRALSFVSVREAAQVIDALGLGLEIFLTSAGLVTLLVGAIGVMNIMLVVVGERTREVGLLKALGASQRAIFLQFLAEAVAMTSVAGLVGGVLGWAFVQWLASVVPDATLAPRPYLEPGTAVVLAAVLVGVGIASGVWPARRASRIEPAISLRSL